jgi:hypothetical protein
MAIRNHRDVPYDVPGNHHRVVDLLEHPVRDALEDRESRLPADVSFLAADLRGWVRAIGVVAGIVIHYAMKTARTLGAARAVSAAALLLTVVLAAESGASVSMLVFLALLAAGVMINAERLVAAAEAWTLANQADERLASVGSAEIRQPSCAPMALATQPDVLLIDEPTTGLDTSTGTQTPWAPHGPRCRWTSVPWALVQTL